MRVQWPNVVLVALVAVRAASAQETAPAQPRTTAAVAAFPDIAPHSKPHTVNDPVADLLDGDPYADALAAIRVRERAYASIVDDDPYAEQLKLVNPYTEKLRSQTRAAKARATSEPLDMENPYTTSLVLETNPYSAR